MLHHLRSVALKDSVGNGTKELVTSSATYSRPNDFCFAEFVCMSLKAILVCDVALDMQFYNI